MLSTTQSSKYRSKNSPASQSDKSRASPVFSVKSGMPGDCEPWGDDCGDTDCGGDVSPDEISGSCTWCCVCDEFDVFCGREISCGGGSDDDGGGLDSRRVGGRLCAVGLFSCGVSLLADDGWLVQGSSCMDVVSMGVSSSHSMIELLSKPTYPSNSSSLSSESTLSRSPKRYCRSLEKMTWWRFWPAKDALLSAPQLEWAIKLGMDGKGLSSLYTGP